MKQENRNPVQTNADPRDADPLSADQIDTVRAALRDVSRGSAKHKNALDPMESHLSDAQFISICMGNLLDAELQECSAHLARCPACEREMQRLRDIDEVWANAIDAARLRDRRKAAESSSISISLEGIIIGVQAALRSLIPPRGAYAHPSNEDYPTVEFLVSDGSEVVTGLIGTLKRRNREFYSRIDAVNAEGQRRFSNRVVVLTIHEPSSAQPILSRRIDVGVAVLLGTDLSLTEESVVEARLLRPDEG